MLLALALTPLTVVMLALLAAERATLIPRVGRH